jgi:hypothetical protein
VERRHGGGEISTAESFSVGAEENRGELESEERRGDGGRGVLGGLYRD